MLIVRLTAAWKTHAPPEETHSRNLKLKKPVKARQFYTHRGSNPSFTWMAEHAGISQNSKKHMGHVICASEFDQWWNLYPSAGGATATKIPHPLSFSLSVSHTQSCKLSAMCTHSHREQTQTEKDRMANISGGRTTASILMNYGPTALTVYLQFIYYIYGKQVELFSNSNAHDDHCRRQTRVF